MKTRDLTEIAVMAALLCVAGPLTVAVGPVPLSLATFAIYLAALVLGSKRAAAVVAVYLLIGAAGIPVFSGFTAGLQKLAGVTGGYLIGYLPCAFVSGLGAGNESDSQPARIRQALRMAAGTLILYTLGTVWFIQQTGNALGAALSLCVLPFLPGDAVKIAAASFLAPQIRTALKNR